MPSPIAHCSMVLLLKPLEKRGLVPDSLKRHRLMLFCVLLFACAMPDIDFLFRALAPGTALGTHGMGMHSLVMTTAMSLVLSGLWWLVFRNGFIAVLLLVLAAGYSHLFFDMMTYRSRGIGLLWPMIDERIRLPWSIFYGVRHSGSGTWLTHLVTVTSESVFVVFMWMIARFLTRDRKPALADTSTAEHV